MPDLEIRPFETADDDAALALESACVQGGSLAVRFRRPTFDARSRVYDDACILCGWIEHRLVGTVAAARKTVELRGQQRPVTYFYDLRVHPNYRGQGISRRLIKRAMAGYAEGAACHYVLVAGQNRPMLRLLRHFRMAQEVSIPLTYVCLPVYRSRKASPVSERDPEEVYHRHVDACRPTFLPAYRHTLMRGHVASFSVPGAGCSVWTNQHLLAEEIVRLPLSLRCLAGLRSIAGSVLPLPEVPAPGQVLRSWFLYDVYAASKSALGRLLDAVNDAALRSQRTVLYVLLQDDTLMLSWVRQSRRLAFTFPYCFIARGECVPAATDRVYVDIRDV